MTKQVPKGWEPSEKAKQLEAGDGSAAAQELAKKLQVQPWLTTVGVGKYRGSPCIIVYVRCSPGQVKQYVPTTWSGIRVLVKKMQGPNLLRA